MLWPVLFFLAVIALAAVHFAWRKRASRLKEQLRRLERDAESMREREAASRREISARQAALLDSITEGVLLLDEQGRISAANHALREMFGIRDAIEGKTLLEAFRLHALSDLVADIAGSGKSGEIELAMPGIRKRFFEVSGARLQRSDGAGIILTLHEITRLKQLENMRKEFVANVSHELRTPLTLIKGFAETLLDGALESETDSRRFIATIQRHADRLSLIIDDLLTISHLESGEVTLEKQSVRLHPLVQRLINDLQSSAAPRGVSMKNLVGLETVVCADLQRLQQVFTNLLENAIKYGRENGTVTIRAGKLEDGLVEIAVADDGPGIPPDALERVFERFYRVDKARSREQGGTGLGLSIVKHIVQSHGGRVWAESELEKGSVFHFTLPTETEESEHAA